uniref:Glycosyltransferase n=1 Tax=viral metagenome TaxID=1070528 RepID=A0A6C0IVT5_9ZZZZ
MIYPLIIHQIWWQGEKNISKLHNHYRKTWIKNHKNYKYILWDKIKFESLLEKLNDKFFNSLYLNLPYMIQKIDLCKYIILYIYGGIYVDIDTISEKPLNNLIKKYNSNLIVSFITVYKNLNYKLINNGIIVSTKKNKFFLYLLEEVKKNIYPKFFYNRDIFILNSTGPILFTDTIRKYLYYSDDIKILDNLYFENNDLGMIRNKGLYITHRHDSSWMSPLFKSYIIIINSHFLQFIIIIILSVYTISNIYIKNI